MPKTPQPANVAASEFSDDQVEFILAMERYMRTKRRRFPSWHEVLAVVHSLGYRKEPRPALPESQVKREADEC